MSATRTATMEKFDLALAPGHLLRRAWQLHTSVWGDTVGTHVTPVQFAILVAIDAEPGIDQRTIGERISLDASTLAEICRRLVDRGLISRVRDERDARRYSLTLTDEGQGLLEDNIPEVEEVGRRMLDGLGDRDRDQLLHLLQRLVHL